MRPWLERVIESQSLLKLGEPKVGYAIDVLFPRQLLLFVLLSKFLFRPQLLPPVLYEYLKLLNLVFISCRYNSNPAKPCPR